MSESTSASDTALAPVSAPTVGAVFRPQLPPERFRSVVRAADEAGLEELWLWEDCFFESGVATASAALAWSQRMRVGVGLLPVPLRNVALLAMETATVQRLFGDRATLAVGHGVQGWMGQVGARVASPLTLLREYTTALRALLAGETVTCEGRYVQLDGVTLEYPPTSPTPVLAGAQGPKSLRLTGEVADGTVIDAGVRPELLREVAQPVVEGRDAAARDGGHQVVVYLRAATGVGAEERIAAEADKQPHRPFGVAGDAETVAEAVRALGTAGAHTVILEPTGDEPDPEGFVRFAAEGVAPLLG